MREIIFRGKRRDNGKWEFGNLIISPYITNCVMIERRERKNGYYATNVVNPESVGQYVGLKDRHGKPIFEGDIVEHYYQKEMSNRGVVMWDTQNARFAHELRTMSPAFAFFNPESWEIVGNIHDNPDMAQKIEREKEEYP